MKTFIKFYRGLYKDLQKIPIQIGSIYMTEEGLLFIDTPAGRMRLESIPEDCIDSNKVEKENENGEVTIYKTEEQDCTGDKTSTNSRYGYKFGNFNVPPTEYESYLCRLRSGEQH